VRGYTIGTIKRTRVSECECAGTGSAGEGKAETGQEVVADCQAMFGVNMGIAANAREMQNAHRRPVMGGGGRLSEVERVVLNGRGRSVIGREPKVL
jgi:hypothetical protein